MRVVIMAVGSYGDVAPYTGLAQRLSEEGHDLAIATHEPYRHAVESVGLGFLPLAMDPREMLTSERGRRASSTSPLALRHSIAMIADYQRDLGAGIIAAAEGADMLLLSPMAWLGWHVAEGMRIRSAGVYLQPWTPTAAFPPASVSTRSLGAWGNKAAARALRTAGQRPAKQVINDLRRDLGLPPMSPAESFDAMDRERWPIFYGYSPIVVPKPPDWPTWHQVTGYWWPAVDPKWEPSANLVDFLDAGPAPVFLGFGSMPTDDADRLSEVISTSVRDAGVRAVVQSGGADLHVTGDDVITVGSMPHSWLFPQMAAVAHHCGAGTAAAGLRAGVPTIPIPVMVDQPFWAKRLHELGVATPPVPARRLTAERLTQGIVQALNTPSMTQRARELAQLIGHEDGYAPVVNAITQALDGA